MRNYFRNWDVMRVVRLVIGVVVMIQGIQAEYWLVAILGGVFVLMPLLNIGCSGGAHCGVPRSRKPLGETTFKEVK